MRKCKKVVQNMFSDIQPNTRKYFRSIFKYATKHLKIIYFSENVFPLKIFSIEQISIIIS